MIRVYFRYCREFRLPAYFCWIIYSYNILKKASIYERISGVVSHSHLFMLDRCQEAIYLILVEMIGIWCEFPNIRAQFLIYLFNFRSEFFKYKPLKSEEFSQSPLKMFAWFICLLKNKHCAYFTDTLGNRFGYVNTTLMCMRSCI